MGVLLLSLSTCMECGRMKPNVDDLEKRVRRLERKIANLDMVITMLKQQNEVFNRLKEVIE